MKKKILIASITDAQNGSAFSGTYHELDSFFDDGWELEAAEPLRQRVLFRLVRQGRTRLIARSMEHPIDPTVAVIMSSHSRRDTPADMGRGTRSPLPVEYGELANEIRGGWELTGTYPFGRVISDGHALIVLRRG